MDNYYKKTDTSKAYLVAAVLDLRVKLKYFEKNWVPEWLIGACENLNTHTEILVQALKLETRNDFEVEPVDKETHDSQESNTTFGSWRASEDDYDDDDDVVEGGIKAEWDEYFKTGRVKDYKGFSLRNW